MSYNTRVREITNDGTGPDPVMVVVAKGTTDVARLLDLLHRGAGEHQRLARQAATGLNTLASGRAALAELAQASGLDLASDDPKGRS